MCQAPYLVLMKSLCPFQNCSGGHPPAENKRLEQITPTLSGSSIEPKLDKSADSISRQKKRDMKVVEEWDKLEFNKV